jgi:hypothetical protein
MLPKEVNLRQSLVHLHVHKKLGTPCHRVTILISEVECRRGSNVIVVHPGSRYLRIGRASDVNPVCVPNVIARKHEGPVPTPVFSEGISRPRNRRPKLQSPAPAENGDEYAVSVQSDDPVRLRNAMPLEVFHFFAISSSMIR